MAASRRGFASYSAPLFVLALVSGCALGAEGSPASPSRPGAAAPTASAGLTGSEGRDLVIVGRILTMESQPKRRRSSSRPVS